jgi:hypothetical protein
MLVSRAELRFPRRDFEDHSFVRRSLFIPLDAGREAIVVRVS